MRKIALLFLLLLSCHQVAPQDPLPSSRWAFDSMHLVLPADAPACLEVTATEAWKLLAPSTLLYIEQYGTGAPIVTVEGLVSVSFEEPPLAGTAALSIMRKRTGLIRNGHIWIPRCDVRLFAHELGHQLGLLDKNRPGHVMNYAVPGIGWDFSPEERAHLSSNVPTSGSL
jgi:hypothetical protein